MLIHAPGRSRANASLWTAQMLAVTQLRQHLQLLQTKLLLDAPFLDPRVSFVLGVLDNSVRACDKQIVEPACAMETDICLNVFEILLEHEYVELHSPATI